MTNYRRFSDTSSQSIKKNDISTKLFREAPSNTIKLCKPFNY